MRFTDRRLLGVKPKTHAFDIREQDGFVLRVYPTGRKTFQYVYRQGGKEKRLTIGEYPTVYGLADARAKHRELYGKVKRGEDPTAERLTVSGLVEKFATKYADKENTKREAGYKRTRLKSLSPIAAMPAEIVKRVDIQNCLAPILERGSPIEHNRTLETIRKMFNWGIQQGLVENNPAYMIQPQKETPRKRTMTDDELRQIMQGSDCQSNLALKLIVLSGCRAGEAQHLCYEDIEKRWWICEQRKGGKIGERRSYLTCAARKLIGNGKGRVFPRINQYGALYRYAAKTYKSDWRPHDIRRTVATRLAELGYSDELIHRYLGHSMPILSRTYNRHRYDRELREMAVRWGRELQKTCR